jgi:hypothetical protein
MKTKPTRLEPVVLATHDSEKELAFSDLDLLGDSLQARLQVRSLGFTAHTRFMADNFASTVAALREMSSKLGGEVRFGAADEDDEVIVSMNEGGQLLVRGTLVKHGEATHRLEFQFRTDQTALVPFVQELESFLESAR